MVIPDPLPPPVAAAEDPLLVGRSPLLRTADPQSPSLRTCTALAVTHGHWLAWVKAQLQPHGLSPNQWEILVALRQDPGLSMTALAQRVGVSKGGLTTLVNGLEAQHWIQRRSVVGNRRRLTVVLTPEGEQRFSQVFHSYTLALQQQLSQWHTPELELLRVLLTKLSTSLR